MNGNRRPAGRPTTLRQTAAASPRPGAAPEPEAHPWRCTWLLPDGRACPARGAQHAGADATAAALTHIAHVHDPEVHRGC